jgi:hypothetical protein
MIDNINIQANVNQYPVSSFNPPAITVNMTYVLEVVPIGGTCNAIPSLMSTCIVADCSILPIELNSFEGKCSSNYAQLFWTTASEQNNDYFTLEGSNIGQDFYNLATIKGAGTSNSVKNYEYVLKENSYKYFRLKQTDFDGKFSLSDIITVNCYENNTLNNISVYPNPATSNLTLNFGDEIDTKIHLIIKDMLGRTAKEILYDANEISFINVSLDYLSKGIYFLQIEDLTNNLIAPLQKFVKE